MTLEDRFELTELVSRLGRFLDERRWDEAPALFTADATASTPGGTAQGRRRSSPRPPATTPGGPST